MRAACPHIMPDLDIATNLGERKLWTCSIYSFLQRHIFYLRKLDFIFHTATRSVCIVPWLQSKGKLILVFDELSIKTWCHVRNAGTTLDGEWSASRPGHFGFWERAPGNRCTGGWASSRTCLDPGIKNNTPTFTGSWTQILCSFSPWLNHYTNCATPAMIGICKQKHRNGPQLSPGTSWF
jgi:hypothetical protein